MPVRKNPLSNVDPLVRSKIFRFGIRQMGEVNSSILLNALEHAEYQISCYRDALRKSKSVIDKNKAIKTHTMINDLLKKTEDQFGKELIYKDSVGHSMSEMI